MEFLKKAAEYIRTWVGNMTAPQKVAVLTLVLLIIGAVVWAATSITTDGMTRIAGTEVTREERDQIVQKLKEKNIKYKVKNEEVYVPKDQADEIVLELHGLGLFSDVMLWKFLDESNITASKWQQEKRYQVALQRKLEKMIGSIKSIQRASVQLTPGDQAQALGFKGAEPAASVTVELRSGKELTRPNVVAIARLVANSMTGLEPHRVLIMDTTGRPYRLPKTDGSWDIAESRLDLKKQYAEWYASQIRLLFPDAMAAVDVELSEKARKETEKILGKAVPVDETNRIRTDKSATQITPPGMKGEGGAGTSGNMKMDVDEAESSAKSAVSEKFIETMVREGEVTGKSAAVVFPVYVGENENPDDVVRKEQIKLPAYEEAVKSIVNMPGKPSIVFMPTRKPGAAPPQTFREKLEEFLEKYGAGLGLLLLAVIALIILYKLLKKALPKGVVEEIEALRRKLAEPEAVTVTPEVALADEELARMKMSIREMIHKNPRSVAGILKRWIFGK